MILSSSTQMRLCVHQSLEEPSVTCVFPTETARRFWVEDYVRTSSQGILRLDRTMAWDTFRSHFLPTSERTPANRMTRVLFARHFLRIASEARMLQWFKYPDSSTSPDGLATSVAQSVVRLGDLELLRTVRPQAYGKLPAAYRHDVHAIASAYRDFLDTRNMFEPNLLLPAEPCASRLPGSHFRIFFPEVCEGWSRFARMDPFPSWIELAHGTAPDPVSPLQVYDNELMELRESLTTIGRMLDRGVSPHDVVITVGNLERWLPYLKEESALQGVPLSIVVGEPVLDYPPGRFLQGLGELASHRFSLDSVRSFLLDPRMPWRDRELHRTLVRRGVELAVVQGHLSAAKDDWLRKLSTSVQQEDRMLLHWYRLLKGRVFNLIRAANPEDLTKALYALHDFLLADGKWDAPGHADAESSRVYAFCLHQLSELGKAIATCGFGRQDRLYALYLQFLGQLEYVPDSRDEGVPVYPYTVSVGLNPAFHVVLGCTLDAIKVEPKRLALVPEYAWDEDIEEDRTETFLAHYGLCGATVRFSASKRGFGATSSLAPPFFVDRDALGYPEYVPADTQFLERCAWASDDPGQFQVCQRQARQFTQALATSFTEPTQDLAANGKVGDIWQRIAEDSELPAISSTEMDRFFDCPMKWAATYLMHLEKGPYDVQGLDHAAIGTCLHNILERFFKDISATTGTFGSQHAATYRQLLDTIMGEEFAAFGRSSEAPPKIALHYIADRYAQQLRQIISAEGTQFESFASIAFEQSIAHAYPEDGYRLRGRIDRILTKTADDGTQTVAVVDYKKRYTESKKQYEQPSGRLPSHQLPLYAKLLRDSEGKDVEIGSFYDIAGGKYHPIWKEGGEDLRDTLIETVEAHARQMMKALRAGVLGATPSKESCSFCDFRQICRRRYALV